MIAIKNEILSDYEFLIDKLKGQSTLGTGLKRVIYHRIFILEEAMCSVIVDGQNISLNPFNILLIAKGQVVSFLKNCGLKGYEILFTDSFWERAPQSASNCKSVLFDRKSENQVLPITDLELAELNSLLGLLYNDFCKSPFTNKADVLAAFLKILMIKLANINYTIKDRYNGFDKNKYTEFLELVASRYRESREVTEYSKILNISNKSLYEICNKQAGLSPKKIINATVLDESKRLLQFTATPIKEIAAVMNFTSSGQFSHFFKKETGISPQKYRELQENFDI